MPPPLVLNGCDGLDQTADQEIGGKAEQNEDDQTHRIILTRLFKLLDLFAKRIVLGIRRVFVDQDIPGFQCPLGVLLVFEEDDAEIVQGVFMFRIDSQDLLKFFDGLVHFSGVPVARRQIRAYSNIFRI